MSDVVVYGFLPSPYVRTVRMTLLESGVEHEVQPFLPGSPEMRALHPLGKIPALTHGDVRLFETLAICCYVAETFGAAHLQPTSPAERAVMLQWWSFHNEEGYPRIVPTIVIPRLLHAPRGEAVDEGAIADAMPVVRRRLEIFDHALGGRHWFAGETMSLADLAVAPTVELLSMTPEGAGLLDGLDNLSPWLERMRERDSFRRTAPDA